MTIPNVRSLGPGTYDLISCTTQKKDLPTGGSRRGCYTSPSTLRGSWWGAERANKHDHPIWFHEGIDEMRRQITPLEIQHRYQLPWEPTTFIFRGYNPFIGGLKPSFFMVLGSKGGWCPIWGRFPCWLIFFKGVETTNLPRIAIFQTIISAIQPLVSGGCSIFCVVPK